MKIKRILLINPPFERLKGHCIESMPLGLLSIATVLDQSGIFVRVYDCDTTFGDADLRNDIVGRPKTQQEYANNIENDTHPAWQEFRRVVYDFSPDIIGITVKTPVYHSSIRAAKIAREIQPDAIIVVGGPHVTITGDSMLNCASIDYAFYGEAEESFVEFVTKAREQGDIQSIDGLIYRKDDKIIKNKRPQRIRPLDTLPFPNKELLVFAEKYKNKLGAIMTSRGCPFLCAFCATVPLWGSVVQTRSPKHILNEMEYLHKKYGVKKYEIVDDTFTLNKSNVLELCKLIVNKYKKSPFEWVCLTNINVVDSELTHYMKKAGCYKINVGIESGSDRILQIIQKNTTTKQIIKASKMIKSAGIQLHGYFMMGIPQETEDDMRKTIQLIKKIKPDSVNLCTFTPYPGTVLYDYVVEKGMLADVCGSHEYDIYKTICTHSDKNYFMTDVSREVYLRYLYETLSLVGKVNKRITIRKFHSMYGPITPQRITRKLFKETKKIINHYAA